MICICITSQTPFAFFCGSPGVSAHLLFSEIRSLTPPAAPGGGRVERRRLACDCRGPRSEESPGQSFTMESKDLHIERPDKRVSSCGQAYRRESVRYPSKRTSEVDGSSRWYAEVRSPVWQTVSCSSPGAGIPGQIYIQQRDACGAHADSQMRTDCRTAESREAAHMATSGARGPAKDGPLEEPGRSCYIHQSQECYRVELLVPRNWSRQRQAQEYTAADRKELLLVRSEIRCSSSLLSSIGCVRTVRSVSGAFMMRTHKKKTGSPRNRFVNSRVTAR
jgi:hypothetical protein